MDSSRPSHLIEVLQPIETFCGLCRKYASYIYCVIWALLYNVLENYWKNCNVSFLCRFNGLYKLCQDAVQLPGAVLIAES